MGVVVKKGRWGEGTHEHVGFLYMPEKGGGGRRVGLKAAAGPISIIDVRIHQVDGIVCLCVWRFYVLYTDSSKGRRCWGKICARTRRYSNFLITVDVFRCVILFRCFDIGTIVRF